MDRKTLSIDGVEVPRFLYGTAWKEADTQRLTQMALRAGFRGVDTANQRKHYFEAAVGDAVRAALSDGLLTRDDLFLQTKFTFRPGQDDRLPYDPSAPVAEQVQQSLASSLEHLGVDAVDSLVLHGPSQRSGLGASDWEAWRAMEAIQQSGGARWLGVSNIDLFQLQQLFEKSQLKPRFVQNRCFASMGWDRDIRSFCAANEITYQGFSLLTANAAALRLPAVAAIAQHHARTIPQIVFRFALQCGMIVLTGTTDEQHMREDLNVFDFSLSAEEVKQIERLQG